MPAPTVPVEAIRHELPFPAEKVNNLVLTGAAKTATKPDGVSWLWLTVSALCYFRTGGTAIVPNLDVTDGTGCMPIGPGNGLLLHMGNISTFSIIGTAVVGLAWYRDRPDGIL